MSRQPFAPGQTVWTDWVGHNIWTRVVVARIARDPDAKSGWMVQVENGLPSRGGPARPQAIWLDAGWFRAEPPKGWFAP